MRYSYEEFDDTESFIAIARQDRRLSQSKLGEMIGRNRAFISRLENGKFKRVSLDEIRGLAIALQIRMDDVIAYCERKIR